MKTFILAIYFCIIFISTNSGDKDTPRNYEKRQVMPQIFAKDVKGKSTSSSRNISNVNIIGTQKQKNINTEGPSIFETKNLGDTLANMSDAIEKFEKTGKIENKTEREKVVLLKDFIFNLIKDEDEKRIIRGG